MHWPLGQINGFFWHFCKQSNNSVRREVLLIYSHTHSLRTKHLYKWFSVKQRTCIILFSHLNLFSSTTNALLLKDFVFTSNMDIPCKGGCWFLLLFRFGSHHISLFSSLKTINNKNIPRILCKKEGLAPKTLYSKNVFNAISSLFA